MSDETVGSKAAAWVGRVLGAASVVVLSAGISWLESRDADRAAEAASAKALELERVAALGHNETADAVEACLEDLDDLAERTAELEDAIREVGLDAAKTASAVEVLLSLAQRSYGRATVERRLDAVEDEPPPLPPPPKAEKRAKRKAPAKWSEYQQQAVIEPERLGE